MTTYIGEWTTVDKSAWGPGPWQEEPDKVHWIDEETDLDCLMVRHPTSGHWCGYVGVTEGHPAFEQGYDAVHDLAPKDEEGYSSLSVHGGLTFADSCREPTEAEFEKWRAKATDPATLEEAARYPRGDAAERLAAARRAAAQTFEEWREAEQPQRICHRPLPGRPARVWWLGFDCAHAWDLSPARAQREYERGLPRISGETYRDRTYVEDEVRSLARQLAAMAVPS